MENKKQTITAPLEGAVYQFKTNSNYTHNSNYNITSKLPSVTIPDQAYTIEELVAKQSAGIIPDIYKQGTFEEEPNIDYPNPFNQDIDLVDRQSITKQINSIRNALNDRNQKLKAKERKKLETDLQELANFRDQQKLDLPIENNDELNDK